MLLIPTGLDCLAFSRRLRSQFTIKRQGMCFLGAYRVLDMPVFETCILTVSSENSLVKTLHLTIIPSARYHSVSFSTLVESVRQNI